MNFESFVRSFKRSGNLRLALVCALLYVVFVVALIVGVIAYGEEEAPSSNSHQEGQSR